MYKKAAVLAIALANPMAIQAVAIQKRDGAGHDHGASHGAASSSYSAPAESYGAPSSNYQPASSYSAPATGYSSPDASYGAPSGGGYAAPAGGYAAPSGGYAAPDGGYSAPSYGPSDGYNSPSYGGDGGVAGLPDLTPLLILGAVLLGLALLFPSYININNGRKKRSVEDDDVSYGMAERVNDIISTVINSESCLQRIACEVGGLASDVGLKNMARLADPIVPVAYKAYVKQFTSGQDCQKHKCGNLAF